ncbi:hypothetical protein DTO164E3_7617 [Paecilomyces variotii]|nr:hypothetical protein DTO164E3_7617 [Paecilomyces variotii]KAJ9194845.1 hypothetical protein DTO032I3_7175 [Paecilomyces variotii]KAJ9244736.1 hypothetical protein DTO169E5_1557 [Paecilomyces variotii]KAJ9257027.1 hypothetical protein DTO207G8_2199 [Paecilomyces variotii]KAJ9261346.1 hypothetical protein DTO195F2_4142 [Paecilomyces variotii]
MAVELVPGSFSALLRTRLRSIASAQPTALTPFLGNCVTEHWVRVHFGSTWWWLMDRGTASPESPGFEVSFGDTSFQAQSALTIIEFPAQGALAAWRRRVSSTISLAIIEPTSRTNIPGSAEESGSCIWFMLCTSSRSVTNPLATIDNK